MAAVPAPPGRKVIIVNVIIQTPASFHCSGGTSGVNWTRIPYTRIFTCKIQLRNFFPVEAVPPVPPIVTSIIYCSRVAQAAEASDQVGLVAALHSSAVRVGVALERESAVERRKAKRLALAAVAPSAVAEVVWAQRVEQASRVRRADDADPATQRIAVSAVAAGRGRAVRVNGTAALRPFWKASRKSQITRMVRRPPLRPATRLIL